MGRLRTQGSLTVVIKLGTSSIIDETTHQPLLSILSSVVETCVKLRSNGHKVVLVSSGAIGVGMKRMNLPGKPKALSGRQALAAIGQGRLIAMWDNLFSHLEQPIAQVLLTRGDISDRSRYLNAVNTFAELFNMGVIPIVNENDTVSVSEIRFGDNDTLSAITASMVHADYLFLLTDVEALYTSNPRKDPHAKAIDIVESVTEIRKTVSTATLGSKLGTGGMETKLIAAEIATAAGVATVVTSSKSPESVFKIIEYNVALNKSRPTSASLSSSLSTPASALSMTSEDTVTAISSMEQDANSPSLMPPRPPHTLFRPSTAPLRDAKSWTAYTLAPAGSILIDAGAHRVLSRRDSGGRLLAVGVVDVSGAFASGQAVKIMVRRRIDGNATTGSTSHTLFTKGKHVTTDGAADSGAASPATPATPGLMATSLSALSVSSLDPFSRSASEGSLLTASAGGAEATPVAGTITLPPTDSQETGTTAGPSGKPKEATVQFSGVVGPEEGWLDVEVGRGLANYNSVEISRIKGVKSSNIVQVLGYADSEYVVENITIHLTA